MKCNLCPRKCNVDRSIQQGYCRVGDTLKVSRAAKHMWEEPCISGTEGSGTVFFSGCNLACVYCQNAEISRGHAGKEISVDRLSEIFIELQNAGCHNINLVTPTHYVDLICRALDIARKAGLKIPVVYNCGGYESVETLRKLKGYIDVYMPDFKYFDNKLALKYSKCPDYAGLAMAAIEEMFSQVGEPVFDNNGMMLRGLIVRHMILPSCSEDSKCVIKYLYDTYGDSIYISLMSQYTPMRQFDEFPELNRRIYSKEYNRVVDYAIELGIENAFIQEGKASVKSFIPQFDNSGV
ncbi:MAG: radical SAM protein [Ruminococcaceae bacterium]|nr:radical SAM protein [Oscillospiraceae bacterium]